MDLAAVDLDEIPAEPPVPSKPPARELFGADCDTVIEASQVTAYCHNSFPRTDLVRLHVECDRWWDIDGDGAAVAVGPMRPGRAHRPVLEGGPLGVGEPRAGLT